MIEIKTFVQQEPNRHLTSYEETYVIQRNLKNVGTSTQVNDFYFNIIEWYSGEHNAASCPNGYTAHAVSQRLQKGAEGRKASSARIATKASSSRHSAKAMNEFTQMGNLISASIVINASSSPSSSGSMNELTRAKNRMNASIVKNALQRQQIASHMREFIRE